MDPILLSRIQFGITTLFHILFPALTIGLSFYLVVVELLWMLTKHEVYYRIYRYWVKFFAVNFGVGVVTGIVLEFEFGTNFSRFSQAAANVISPLLSFEVMTAFFLESGFLGIMLFGWKRVSRPVHFLSTCLVAAGSIISSFWILAANSWMQTPAGFTFDNGKFMLTDFYAALFNPSTVVRVLHMTTAGLETSAFVVAGVSAWYLLKDRFVPVFRTALAIALIMAAVVAPLQMALGDWSARVVVKHQPAKLAAMESHWDTNTGDEGAPFAVIALPDPKEEKNRFEVSIPRGLSLLATHSFGGQVKGLKEFPREDRPNVGVLFVAFRVMAAIGTLYFLIMFWAFVLWRKKTIFTDRSFLKTLLFIHPLGFLAVETGWITTEVGRQPWLVYNLFRTAQGVSPVPAGNVVWSLALFIVIFAAVGGVFSYFLVNTIRQGPDVESPIPLVQRPAGMRPLKGGDRTRDA